MGWQDLGRWAVICVVATAFYTEASSQQNLVSNGSFETHQLCPDGYGQIDVVHGWVSIRGSVDYFNSCGSNGYGLPDNDFGFQTAIDGDAYIGMVFWAFGIPNAREYVGAQLIQRLEAGKKYNVRLVLSLADTVSYAIRNVGVLFTEGQPDDNLSQLLNTVPQVQYSDSQFLFDKEEWMLIEGSFIAQGVEQFITIGNFNNDGQTDTIAVSEQSATGAYYFVDNVSVVEDTSWHVGINPSAPKKGMLELWPNPATGVLTVETSGKNIAFELMDVHGKVVLQQTMQAARQTIDVSHLSSGVYVAVLRQKGVAVARRKVVIQR